MIDDKKILAVIPARGGSKGIPRKNISDLAGKPLIAWTIDSALKSTYLDRVIVSTESPEIGDIAVKYGADVPFLRPEELATDSTPGIDPVLHVIEAIGEGFDCVILLQPTSPLRNENHINDCIEIFVKNNYSTIVSVTNVVKHPNWMFSISQKGSLFPYLAETLKTSRQENSELYVPNGAIYLSDIPMLKQERSFFHRESYPFYMDSISSIDIDTPADLFEAELVIRRSDLSRFKEIIETYTRAGFGNLQKKEIDSLIFRQLVELYLEEKIGLKVVKNPFMALSTEDIYTLGAQLKLPTNRINNLITQAAARYSSYDDEINPETLIDLINSQIHLQRDLGRGMIKLQLQNPHMRYQIEKYLVTRGSSLDYSFNRSILLIDLLSLMILLSGNDGAKLVSILKSRDSSMPEDIKPVVNKLVKQLETGSSKSKDVFFHELFSKISVDALAGTLTGLLKLCVIQ